MSVPVSASAAQSAPSAASATVTRAQQQAQLTRLLQFYQNNVNKGETTARLQTLAKQITELARQLAENVTLPTDAPPGAAAAGGTPPATAATGNLGTELDITG